MYYVMCKIGNWFFSIAQVQRFERCIEHNKFTFPLEFF